MKHLPLLVFSHLRWDFVFQRPQHLLSRIAREREVVYVEEPVQGELGCRVERALPGLEVLKSSLPMPGPPFGSAQENALTGLLREFLDDRDWNSFSAWLYTPMAARLASALHPRTIVYDCMDELSAFLDAPTELIRREEELFGIADVVFTGGLSLYRSKRDRHPFVHCFPSSVDIDHFASAARRDLGSRSPAPNPRLGYYGVIDERIDLGIVRAVAESHPEWRIEMIGPVAKINPASLPQRANLSYGGQQPYERLPEFVAGWDVCLMPFALDRSTRYISPTKVLEYMAAERPIVSTPIHDVVELYHDIVHLGWGEDGFIQACERALAAPEIEREARQDRARSVLLHTSWDRTAREMHDILCALESRVTTAPDHRAVGA